MAPVLSCRDLTKTFQGSSGEVIAIDHVEFEVRPGEFLCIVGPSGCGKTTLLKLIAGLLSPSSGQIVSARTVQSHPQTALVFQDHGLFPWMTVLENAAFGLEMQGSPRHLRRVAAQALLETFGVGEFSQHYPHELSIGMRQRVGIARAFAADPEILLMDEPFGALDAQIKVVMQEELLRVWRENQKIVIYVTHDIQEAVVLGDRILVMSGRPGRIREEIAVELPRPRSPWETDEPELAGIKRHIWKTLEQEVRRNARVPGG